MRHECKMRHEVVSTIILSACLLSTMVWPPFMMPINVDSKTIYVDASNINDPYEDGSAEHPFDSIQEGVDAAKQKRLIPDCRDEFCDSKLP